eukprot:CAMPEP_0198734912 /NCGR_PEP_ID=MMETSP1475-20131203/55955_1 /TAXON_ID= ORGANISM="Unidentified sp., Strain CCMP1999" /NCGR_SAMPLE_ID=MMETSP1475 /ASSEMBLY_ACC=CAM_ASM_001111 /LENGTH=406 /DNA_ID=CAMNT_0044498477 /DNA_START=76 /DNA_END=1292 /DNA_ORIENTATION=+
MIGRKALGVWVLVVMMCATWGQSLEVEDLAGASLEQMSSISSELSENVHNLDRLLADIKSQVDEMEIEVAGVDGEMESRRAMRQNGAHRKELLRQLNEQVAAKQRLRDEGKEAVEDVRQKADALRNILDELEKETEKVEEVYTNPTLSDLLDKKSEEWSPVTRTLYTKTKRNILPSVWSLSSEMRSYQNSIRQKSRLLGLFAAFLMYGFNVTSIFVLFYVYKRLSGQMSVSKLIFMGDTFCCCFWLMTLLCYTFLWTDPLYVIKQRNQSLFFFSQLFGGIVYMLYVFLRVIVLADALSLGPFGELSSVIIVGHHIYVRIWQPALTDNPFHGSFFHYLCYAWLFSTFTYRGIAEFSPLKQLRGPRLGFITWLRVVYKRFTLSRIPNGDLLPRRSAAMYESSSEESPS